MRLVLWIAVVSALSCRADRKPAGGACEETFECKPDLVCLAGLCSVRVTEGGACDTKETGYNGFCEYALTCSKAGICETEETRKAREAAEAVEHERDMLRQSGVAESDAGPPSAERPAPGPAAGLPIRVSRAKGAGQALAACRDDERLVGGGCNSEFQAPGGYPSHFDEFDTVGARWNCSVGSKATVEVEAYALCQALE